MVITIAEFLKCLFVVVPSILASVTTLTGVINGAFNVQDGRVKHIISWALPILLGILTVATGGMTLGLGWIDYVVGAFVGALAGGASNGLYNWHAIEEVIDKLYYLFGHGATIERKKAARAAKLAKLAE